jgi:septal ring factor EnvC (AmiA/AmiB activator)
MNLVGKIFTVLIFLMAVVFGAFGVAVHATHKNWMNEVMNPETGRDVQLKRARELNAKLASQKAELEKEIKDEKIRHQDSLTKLETTNQTLRRERDAHEKAVAEKDMQIRTTTIAITAIQDTLKNLRVECDSMRTRIKEAEAARDDNFAKVVKLTEDLNNSAQERIKLEKQNGDLTNEYAKALECLAYFQLNHKADFKAKSPPPDLQGVVTAVPRPDVVEISIGSDDGVRKGHKLEVVRVGAGKSYVGRIEVLETTPDRAICRPSKDLQRSQIQKGDRVYGSLSAVK